jgi:hypothetical protein
VSKAATKLVAFTIVPFSTEEEVFFEYATERPVSLYKVPSTATGHG